MNRKMHLITTSDRGPLIVCNTCFEEYVLPFKESIYINGFEWENDVFTKPEKRIKNKLLFKDKEYKAKITIKTFPTSLPKRLIAFLFTESVVVFAFYSYKSFLLKKHD